MVGGGMSTGMVLSFVRRISNSSDWSQQELAEFYRVESALLQGGLSVSTDRGVSDEGDPWFVFCRADNEDVIAHFARIDREYVVVSNLTSEPIRSTDFRRLIRQLVEANPMMLPVKRAQGQKLFVHPAALLTALLASAYFFSSEKDLASGNGSSDGGGKSNSIGSLLTEKFAAIAAVGLAVIWIEHQAESLVKFFESGALQGLFPDDQATQATSSNEFIQPDTSVMQALQAGDSGAHKLDSANGSVPPQESDNHGVVSPTQVANASPNATSAPDDGHANLTNAPATSADDHGTPGHLAGNDADSLSQHASAVVVSTIMAPAQLPAPSAPNSEAADNGHSSSTGPSAAPVGAGTNSDAFQVVAAELSNSLSQAVVLSDGGGRLGTALHQVLSQVGFDTQSADGSTDSSGATSTASAVTVANSTSAIADVSSAILGSTSSLVKFVEGQQSAPVSQIEQTLEVFIQDTPSREVAISGSHIIIIDTNLADAKSPNFGIETWHMGDGSTLSIVGIIPHHHTAAAA
jgi:hypothetical protein